MRVAIFSDTFNPQINGVTNTINKMAKYFNHKNIKYKIFAPQYDENTQISSANTERYYSLKFFLYPDCRVTIPNIFRLQSSLSSFKPDIIHLMTEFNLGVAGLNYAKKNNIPCISTYTTNFSQYTEFYNLEIFKKPIWDYMRWFHSKSNLTVCPSYDAKNLLYTQNITNTEIFTRGVDTDFFSPKYRSISLRKKLGIDDKTVFLYVGRVSYEKDLDTLAKAYNMFKDKYDDTALVITGDGPYMDKAKSIFPENTIFTGFKRGKDLAQMYASSDIFICPSPTETLGNVVLEAMASGLAPIGANKAGVGEAINHLETGLKFVSGDSYSLYQTMEKLYLNKSLDAYLKNNAINYAKSRSWDSILSSLVDIYSNIVKSHKEKQLTA